MPFVEAKCPNCGGSLMVDSEKRLAVCRFCREPYIVEEAINNYVTNNNTYNTTNIAHADVVNVIAPAEEEFVIKGGVLKKYTGSDIDVTIPDGVKAIGAHNGAANPGPFFGCAMVQSIAFPPSVELILERGVSECRSLRRVRFSEGLREIEEGAFSSNEKLTEISLPDSCETIEKGAFSCCRNLQKAKLPRSLRVLPSLAFSECGCLREITWPNKLEEIGDWAFSSCRSLKKVSLPDGLKRLGDCAFYNCEGLEEIDIPPTVTHFGDSGPAQCDIFYGCHNLRSITVGEKTPAIIFAGVRESIRTITAPRGWKDKTINWTARGQTYQAFFPNAVFKLPAEEQAELNRRGTELRSRIARVKAEMRELTGRKAGVEKELSGLGLFAGARKKLLRDEISELDAQLVRLAGEAAQLEERVSKLE